MKIEALFKLAEPYLKKNYFGVAHTKRVFDIARENFDIPAELEDPVFPSIVLHDIGGSTVKEQYERGPEIALSILRQLGYNKAIIQEVCEIIRTHHDRPQNPSEAFRILYDSDRLVMFSQEEFSHYNSRPNFNWASIIDSMYSEYSKNLAKRLLQQRVMQNEGKY